MGILGERRPQRILGCYQELDFISGAHASWVLVMALRSSLLLITSASVLSPLSKLVPGGRGLLAQLMGITKPACLFHRAAVGGMGTRCNDLSQADLASSPGRRRGGSGEKSGS